MKTQADQLYADGRYAEAGDLYRQLTEQYPAQGAFWWALGLALALQHDSSGGIEACQKAVTLLPQDPEALYALGYCYGAANRYDEAIEELDKALLVQPLHVAARQSLVYALATRAQELAVPDPLRAEQHLNRARKLDSKNPELYANLLNFYVQTRQKGKALKLIEESEPTMRASQQVEAILGELAQNPDYAIALKSTLRSAKRTDSRPISAPSSIRQVPCPKCGQLMPEYASACPHCHVSASTPSMFTRGNRVSSVIWQEVMLTIFGLLWACMAGFEIFLFMKSGGGPFVGYLIVLDIVRVIISLIVLFRSDWISSAAKIICYITLASSAALFVIQAGLSHWGAASFEAGQLIVTAFLIYLVNFNLGD